MFGRKQRHNTVIDTLVGSNSSVSGDLHFAGGCHVDGRVKGNVTADPVEESASPIPEEGPTGVPAIEGAFSSTRHTRWDSTRSPWAIIVTTLLRPFS